jgi:hypothetical protein
MYTINVEAVANCENIVVTKCHVVTLANLMIRHTTQPCKVSANVSYVD